VIKEILKLKSDYQIKLLTRNAEIKDVDREAWGSAGLGSNEDLVRRHENAMRVVGGDVVVTEGNVLDSLPNMSMCLFLVNKKDVSAFYDKKVQKQVNGVDGFVRHFVVVLKNETGEYFYYDSAFAGASVKLKLNQITIKNLRRAVNREETGFDAIIINKLN